MRLPYKCPLCSKTFRTPQGRRGHLTFKHGMGKRSIYTDAIGKMIGAYQEGMEYVKRERKRLPRKVLRPEKREKVLAFASEWEGRGDEYEIENKEDIISENERRGYKEGSGHEEERGDRKGSGVGIWDIE